MEDSDAYDNMMIANAVYTTVLIPAKVPQPFTSLVLLH